VSITARAAPIVRGGIICGGAVSTHWNFAHQGDDRKQDGQEQPVLIAGQGAAHGEREGVRRPDQHVRRQRVAGQQRPAQHRQPERGHHREAEQPRGLIVGLNALASVRCSGVDDVQPGSASTASSDLQADAGGPISFMPAFKAAVAGAWMK
jgi:hypothetical protein